MRIWPPSHLNITFISLIINKFKQFDIYQKHSNYYIYLKISDTI